MSIWLFCSEVNNWLSILQGTTCKTCGRFDLLHPCVYIDLKLALKIKLNRSNIAGRTCQDDLINISQACHNVTLLLIITSRLLCLSHFIVRKLLISFLKINLPGDEHKSFCIFCHISLWKIFSRRLSKLVKLCIKMILTLRSPLLLLVSIQEACLLALYQIGKGCASPYWVSR